MTSSSWSRAGLINAGHDARRQEVEQGRHVPRPDGRRSSTPTRQGDDEQGLLGLAFHPNYSSNGLFYVYYTRRGHGTDGRGGHRRVSAPGGSGAADPSVGPRRPQDRACLRGARPTPAASSPSVLTASSYIGIGDGGVSGDPIGIGQDISTLLGKILGIDPRDPDGGGPSRLLRSERQPVRRSGWAR